MKPAPREAIEIVNLDENQPARSIVIDHKGRTVAIHLRPYANGLRVHLTEPDARSTASDGGIVLHYSARKDPG